jgi:hypothetical protein
VSEANARPTGPSARARASQSPNCIRQRVGRAGHHGVAQGRRIQNPRHGRMQFCATPLARSCRPFHGFLSTMLPRVAGKRGTSVRSRTKAPMNRTHSRRFARSGARHRKSRQRLECGRFSAAFPAWTGAASGWQGNGGRGTSPSFISLPPFLCPSPAALGGGVGRKPGLTARRDRLG